MQKASIQPVVHDWKQNSGKGSINNEHPIEALIFSMHDLLFSSRNVWSAKLFPNRLLLLSTSALLLADASFQSWGLRMLSVCPGLMTVQPHKLCSKEQSRGPVRPRDGITEKRGGKFSSANGIKKLFVTQLRSFELL